MRRILDFLRSDDVPLMTRPNFWVEVRHLSLWSVVAGAIEGNLASVIVSNTFDASKLLTTIVWAIPLVANMLNVVWGVLLRGRRRMPMMFILAGCVILNILLIALVPSDSPWGGWWFAGQLALVHVFGSGLITLRIGIWQANYPTSHRARIAGRLQSLRVIGGMVAASLLGMLFDWDAQYYRYAYPAVALIGAVSLLPLRKLRIRGEKSELRRMREHLRQRHAADDGARSGLWRGLRESAGILRRDKRFAGYMTAQFFLGSANFMVDPVLVAVLTKELFPRTYLVPLLLMQLVPFALLLVTIRFWGPYFDRVGVLRFRLFNTLFWISSYVGVTAAMILLRTGGESVFTVVVAVLIVARICNGIARGGGAVAWPLGHLHFAAKNQAELYMGIHVALTGLRGLIMPLAGWALHEWLGWGSFLIALGSALFAYVLFIRLYRKDRRAALAQEAHAEEISAPAAGADQAS